MDVTENAAEEGMCSKNVNTEPDCVLNSNNINVCVQLTE